MENTGERLSYEAVEGMRDSVSLADQIASCDRLIESSEAPDSVKDEMKEKKEYLIRMKEGQDSFIINNIRNKDNR